MAPHCVCPIVAKLGRPCLAVQLEEESALRFMALITYSTICRAGGWGGTYKKEKRRLGNETEKKSI